MEYETGKLYNVRAVKFSDFIRIIGFYVDTALTRTDFAFQFYILGFCYAVSHAPIYVARARHQRRQDALAKSRDKIAFLA